ERAGYLKRPAFRVSRISLRYKGYAVLERTALHINRKTAVKIPRAKIEDMLLRVVFALLAACAGALAQTALSVDQLTSFLKSSLQLKQPDRQVARFLERVKMTERLEDRTIEEMQGYGIGPKTVEALQQLRDASQNLPVAQPKTAAAKPAPIPPPSSEEQARVIHEVRENALNYSKNLPDFICTQVTRRYYDPSGLEFWQMSDVITARLSYFEQKEEYKLIMVNNQVTNEPYSSLRGAVSYGEFGSMLREIFEPESKTDFQWERWATLRGKRTHVFSYRVAQPNSRWSINYERTTEVTPGYRGLIYVEKASNTVLRITLEAEDIPPSFPVQQASTVLDYDYSRVGDGNFLLPLRGVMRMRSDKLLTKNEMEFRLYRKFSSESTITFETPAPLPEDQTKEQPPKN